MKIELLGSETLLRARKLIAFLFLGTVVATGSGCNLSDSISGDSPKSAAHSGDATQGDDSSSSNPSAGVQGPITPKTLSWNTPWTREDGSSLALSEIAAYEVAYRNLSEGDDGRVVIDDVGVTSLKLSGFASGKYGFKVRVIDYDGVASDYSQEVTATLNNG
ncbi:fibronectin type III domain-containing protein [Hahella sp. KA22]|uniref:fibronectin type III domain-containing protein n=1 Tax=unclassified Hahella TaxID=2624107 RepID=UPI000FDD4CDC|nr:MULTISPECIES: fibronectin type III domain-containing protein [unclassified Hahella]AZZ94796.1 fibronectin type III domain-containing protein [Hahella sp. KA22]MDG9667112.1 fibronectin type III domain-containing protein [Hahella sp. CR1]QAY58170.1 fibronectin type III domain-containing protein [Hahella sp. KA22]